MRRHAFLIGLSWLFLVSGIQADTLPRGDARDAGFAPDRLKDIPAALQTAVDKKQIIGGSTLIARKGKVVHFATVGMQDLAAKVPMSEGTIFRIASMSKPITSVAVMILVDDGKLNVTDPLSRFVPEFKNMTVLIPAKDGSSHETVKAAREITIHDLLTHTSGLTYRLLNKPVVAKMYADAGVSDGLVESSGTIGDNVRKLARLPLVCQPGAAWEYGLNTDVLGHVVEVVSGKTLDQFLRERVFEPLKMADTAFVLPKEKHARLATLYSVGPDRAIVPVGAEPVTVGSTVFSSTYSTKVGSKYYSGGAGLCSTAGDYVRFCQMMLNRGELDGARILKPETVDRMTQNQIGKLRIPFPGSNVMGYGFGILSDQGKDMDPAAVGTYSWAGAFSTNFWIDPKNEVIGVFMTQIFPPDFALAQEFKRLTYEALSNGKK